jgi:protein-S-isoprenylcysteine O-methyltransferase Ste14
MAISFLRVYLLCGLLLHKALWEAMNDRRGSPARRDRPWKSRLLSGIKVGILLGIAAQTLLPDFLPVSRDPGVLRATGAALYTFGLLAAMTGRIQLGRNWSDIEKSYLKQDHALVARGIYRYVRHPIYAGDLLLLLGLELALNSWCAAGVMALAIYVRRQTIREESQLLRDLPGYGDYCRRTSRFLPFVPV